MRQLLALSMLLVLAPAPAERSFKVEVSKVAWQPVEISGMPKGLQQRVLHDDKEKHVVSAIVRYPKGFHEPRHYHTTCGHSIYILKGKPERRPRYLNEAFWPDQEHADRFRQWLLSEEGKELRRRWFSSVINHTVLRYVEASPQKPVTDD